MFEKLQIYQSDVVKLLHNSFIKNRIVHTYLFHGQKGTMKMEAARYFASLLLCENGGVCGKCPECESIMKNKNPNVFIIRPDGNTIKKEQIMELEHEFSRASDQKRVFIIEHIDYATPSSANSLLKFLEEANENNYGILITENINMVMTTIKSRSQVVSFNPISRTNIIEKLVELKIDCELASVISTLTNDPDEAFILSKDQSFKKMVNFVKLIGMSFESNQTNPILIFKNDGKDLLNEGKQVQEQFLDILITLQNDKIKYLINPETPLVFRELMESSVLSLDEATEIKILEIMIDLQSKIRYNLNVELALLNMLIEIVGCVND